MRASNRTMERLEVKMSDLPVTVYTREVFGQKPAPVGA